MSRNSAEFAHQRVPEYGWPRHRAKRKRALHRGRIKRGTGPLTATETANQIASRIDWIQRHGRASA